MAIDALYVSSLAMITHAMRVLLLAMATLTSLLTYVP